MFGGVFGGGRGASFGVHPMKTLASMIYAAVVVTVAIWLLVTAAMIASCIDATEPKKATPGTFWTAGYWWEPDPNEAPCTAYEWIQLPPPMILSICGEGKIGCRVRGECTIESMYTEPEARIAEIEGTGETHRDHERRHVLGEPGKGVPLRHPAWE